VLELRRLAVFREIVRRGSFAAAADALSHSQPAVSHQIARLESELGAKLLERGRGAAAPTRVGAVLLRHAEALLDRAAEAERDVALARAARPSELRLMAFATAAATIVADAICLLRSQRPELALTLSEGDPDIAHAAVRGRRVDVAVAFDDAGHPLAAGDGLVAEHLRDDPMLVALPAAHRLAGAQRVALSDLREEPWIEGAGPAALILRGACAAAGFAPRVALSTGNFAYRSQSERSLAALDLPAGVA